MRVVTDFGVVVFGAVVDGRVVVGSVVDGRVVVALEGSAGIGVVTVFDSVVVVNAAFF
ncbi:unannotated protein [freshwater metagenome]|uniref:Unannotated protein n=1 Tax=freshwater metagenome TaxID=449393 RepID=A0A6J6H0J7_9ZZZZ|nr:hypothetical protein [Actinomycetota bacterium]